MSHQGNHAEAISELQALAGKSDALALGIVQRVQLLLLDVCLATHRLAQASGVPVILVFVHACMRAYMCF